MPKYESDHDKQQRTDAAAKLRKDSPSAHTNKDTASVLTPEEQDLQEKGNAELHALRDKMHKGELSAADQALEQRLTAQKARFDERKAEMKRMEEQINNPPVPQVPATNPSNITSPATHLPVDTTMGEGEP